MKPAPEHNRLSAFNGTLSKETAPKKGSWWTRAKAKTRAGFNELHADEQPRLSADKDSAKLAIRSLDPR